MLDIPFDPAVESFLAAVHERDAARASQLVREHPRLVERSIRDREWRGPTLECGAGTADHESGSREATHWIRITRVRIAEATARKSWSTSATRVALRGIAEMPSAAGIMRPRIARPHAEGAVIEAETSHGCAGIPESGSEMTRKPTEIPRGTAEISGSRAEIGRCAAEMYKIFPNV